MAIKWKLDSHLCMCCRLLVGAPRAKALGGQKAKVTGGLFNCDTSSTSTSCTRINFDNDGKIHAETPAFIHRFVVHFIKIPIQPQHFLFVCLLCLCRGFNQRKQRKSVDGCDSQQSGARWQDSGKTVFLSSSFVTLLLLLLSLSSVPKRYLQIR